MASAGRGMKLLFVNTGNSTRLYGVERWMLRAALGLRERGHHPVIAGPAGRALLQAACRSGIAAAPFRFRTDFSPVGLARMRRLLRRHGPELICVKGAKTARLVGLAQRIAGAARPPIVLRAGARTDVRDARLHDWTHRRFVSCCLTPSESLRREILSCSFMDPARVEAIPNGIRPDLFDPERPERGWVRSEWSVPERAVVLGMVGRLQARKRPDWAVRALAALAAAGRTDTRLVLVGSGSLQGELEALSARFGLADRVRFDGYSDDVPRKLQGFDLFLCPSDSEGMPSSVLEAMAAGLAVIATESGPIGEVVVPGVTGEIVGTSDYEAFAAAVARLVASPDRRESWGAAGRRRVESEFAEARMLDRIEALFGRLARETRPGSPRD